MIVAFVKRYKIALAVALVCLCFVACAAGGVYAYLSSVTDPLVNELVPAQVACRVEETFENGVKENVRIRNIGNVDAFVRVTVVINFVSEDGSKILAASPMEGTNYSIVWEKTAGKKEPTAIGTTKPPLPPKTSPPR